MASPLKRLAGQTAIYGLSSIVGRFLNYFLTPLYTGVFTTEQYGINIEMYAYVAFLVVLLMYGMETAFFRYYSAAEDKKTVYSTALLSLLVTTSAFIASVFIFAQPIADFLKYPDHSEYVSWFGTIIGLDALIAIPMARLRADNCPIKFSFINFSFIGVNIGLNLLIFVYALPHFREGNSNWFIDIIYNPEIGVGYIFIINLIASLCRFVLVIPDILNINRRFDLELWKKMLSYGTPLLIVGLAGIINETLDKPLLKWFLIPELGESAAQSQLGIYGGVYKLSIAISLFVQAYRYAAEPFFFDQKKAEGSKETYAKMLHMFTAFVLTAFLIITLFIDVFKQFLRNEEYYVALDIVPLLLLANIFLGIYYNLSVWYKLTDKTVYGMYLAITGAAITIGINLWLIPIISYRGAAIATLACYFSMAVLSFIFGQKYYHVPYSKMKLLFYFGIALGFYFLNLILPFENPIIINVSRGIMVAIFLVITAYLELIKPRRNVIRN